MKTVCIQIGNSDDKLSQAKWAEFVGNVGEAIRVSAGVVHFAGGSSNEKPWQNYCWVIEFGSDPIITSSRLIRQLAKIRADYGQDSIAWTEGETLFV